MNAEEKLKEQERIIRLIELFRPHCRTAKSLQLGDLIDAIRGDNDEFLGWLEETEAKRLRLERIHRGEDFYTFDTGYEARYVSRIDDLTTDQWGGAGPDCRTKPVLAGI